MHHPGVHYSVMSLHGLFRRIWSEFKITFLITVHLLYVLLYSVSRNYSHLVYANQDIFYDFMKKAALECLLEGCDGLIKSILDSIQRVSQIPKTQYGSLLFSDGAMFNTF